MASIVQAPAPLELAGVAGSPFGVVLNVSLTDSLGHAIPWSAVSSPVVVVDVASGPLDPSLYPAVTSPGTGQWTLNWTAAQTALLAEYSVASWSLSATINGSGPLALLAGSVNFDPSTAPGAGSSLTASLAVQVGTATAAVAVTLGVATLGGIDGGAPDTVYLPAQSVDGGGP